MQRLNAITAFIEGEFSINGHYFNLESVAQTKAKKDEGELVQKEPFLPVEECSRILDYPVPFSVFDESEPGKLDESFRRINTGGRMLSRHDVRQAGALGLVPDLINAAAIFIRKDSSHSNVVDLRNMKNISLSNDGLKYGINIREVFWARHGIILHDNIRMSRDEELVAHLLAYMADPEKAKTSSEYLDAIYLSSSEESQHLTRKINEIGKEVLHEQFCYVFNEVSKSLDACNVRFKNLVFGGKPNKVALVFQVVFIAFYKALITYNLNVSKYDALCQSLLGVYEKHLAALNSDRKWTAEERNNLSNAVLGLIQPHFVKKTEVQRQSQWVGALENILNESKTEQICYDFKIGFVRFAGDQDPSPAKVVSKIVKTLSAMTNAKLGDCYVIVGVADKASDAAEYDAHYGSTCVEYNGFMITGIESEALRYHGNIGGLEQKVIQLIEKEPISDQFKSKIKAGLITFSYNDKQMMIFKAHRGDQPEIYAGKFYTRTLSHLEEVAAERFFNFFEIFKKEIELDTKGL